MSLRLLKDSSLGRRLGRLAFLWFGVRCRVHGGQHRHLTDGRRRLRRPRLRQLRHFQHDAQSGPNGDTSGFDTEFGDSWSLLGKLPPSSGSNTLGGVLFNWTFTSAGTTGAWTLMADQNVTLDLVFAMHAGGFTGAFLFDDQAMAANAVTPGNWEIHWVNNGGQIPTSPISPCSREHRLDADPGTRDLCADARGTRRDRASMSNATAAPDRFHLRATASERSRGPFFGREDSCRRRTPVDAPHRGEVRRGHRGQRRSGDRWQ